jgi:hypothetical protein
MSKITSIFVRFCAAPALAVGVIGGTALGLAGMANATTGPAAPTTTNAPAPVGPGYQYYPETYATPAPGQLPGWQNHHGPNHVN